jgi:hypothetical protein
VSEWVKDGGMRGDWSAIQTDVERSVVCLLQSQSLHQEFTCNMTITVVNKACIVWRHDSTTDKDDMPMDNDSDTLSCDAATLKLGMHETRYIYICSCRIAVAELAIWQWRFVRYISYGLLPYGGIMSLSRLRYVCMFTFIDQLYGTRHYDVNVAYMGLSSVETANKACI